MISGMITAVLAALVGKAASQSTTTSTSATVLSDNLETQLPQLGSVTQTWRVPQAYPEGIAYDKTNQRILLSSLVSGTIVSLNATNDMERQTVYVPSIETPGSGMGLKFDQSSGTPLVYATIGNFATMDKGGLALYELNVTGDQLAFAQAVDPSPYFMPCLDGETETMCGLANDVVLGDNGVVYVTDSMDGRVFKVKNGVMDLVSEDSLLQWEDDSFPFGANGIVYDSRGFLIVGNTEKESLVRVDLESGEVMSIPVSGSLGNPDGMLMHSDGRLFVVTGTAIRVLRDEDNEWQSAVVEGMIDIDFSAEGESATTAAFGEDDELYVTFVRFNDLLGGGINQNPALLARVNFGDAVAPTGTTEAPATGGTETPVKATTTTVLATDSSAVATTANTTEIPGETPTLVTDTPVTTTTAPGTTDAPVAGSTFATAPGYTEAQNTATTSATTISAKAAKASSKSSKLSSIVSPTEDNGVSYLASTSVSAKSEKPTSTMNDIMSRPAEKPLSKSFKESHGDHSMPISSAISPPDEILSSAPTSVNSMSMVVLITTTAKSSKSSHDYVISLSSKAAKKDAPMSILAAKATKSSFNDGSISMPSTLVNPKSTKIAKGGNALFEANIQNYSSESINDESMPIGNVDSHSKSGKSSAKSDKDGSIMNMNTASKSAKYRVFRSKHARADSLFN